jgi:hypothetical protein
MLRMRGVISIMVIAVGAIGAGIGAYAIESMIHEREQKIRQLTAEIIEEQERITVLEADWSYLTRPSRIQSLSQEMLSFSPIETQRILTLDMLDGQEGAETERKNDLYRIKVIEGDG